jgi:hypothetical protein
MRETYVVIDSAISVLVRNEPVDVRAVAMATRCPGERCHQGPGWQAHAIPAGQASLGVRDRSSWPISRLSRPSPTG